MNPLPWQVAAKLAVVQSSSPAKLVVAATGSGKTAFAHYLVQERLARGERVLWIAHRKELVTQPQRTLERWWPEVRSGIIRARSNENDRQMTYASKDTLVKPGRLEAYLEHGYPATVVVDEAHHSTSKTWATLLDRLSAAELIGLTATPESGRRMSERWDLVYTYSIIDAINDHVLVPPYCVVDRIPNLDLAKLALTAGDYDTADLERELIRCHVVEHTVQALQKEHEALRLPFRDDKRRVDPRGLATLVFTVTVAQAFATSTALMEAGFRAKPVWGDMPEAERAQALLDFTEGRLDVLVSPAALTEGTDLPIAKVVVLARPTRSHTLFIQGIGRALRRYLDHDFALVIDLCGASKDHSIISAPALVDGVDCPKSEDGKHRYLGCKGEGGRCQDCGHYIPCLSRGGTHEFKDGRCKSCGALQCPDSPTSMHGWSHYRDGKRACVHCAMEIPDPLAAMVAGAYVRKEPVNWLRLSVPGRVHGTDLGAAGTMFSVAAGEKWVPFLYARRKLTRLARSPVSAEEARALTDDVARQARKVKGQYGGTTTDVGKYTVKHRLESLAVALRLWEEA